MSHISLKTLPRCVRTQVVQSPIIAPGDADISATPIGVSEWGGKIKDITFTVTTAFTGTGNATIDIGYGRNGYYRVYTANDDAFVEADDETLDHALRVGDEVPFTLVEGAELYRGDVITVKSTRGDATAGQGFVKVYFEPEPLYAEDDMTFPASFTTTSTSTSTSTSG